MVSRLRLVVFLVATCSVSLAAGNHSEPWRQAELNGHLAQDCFIRCRDYVRAWLGFADPATGLIPRNLDVSRDFWNGKDSAADNYPFMVLTASIVDRELFHGRMLDMLRTETRLTSRLDNLVDDYSFSKQGWRMKEADLERMIFESSEYVKDGLMPLTEWLGRTPWSERMIGLVDSILDHARVETPVGRLPAKDYEVGGELMQVLSRLYWMTGQERYRETAFRYADYFFFHDLPTDRERLSLDDHGCEVIGGLSEVYYLAARTDSHRRERYKRLLYKMLDRILEVGRNENGLFYMVIDPVNGKVLNEELTDNWGYDYNAYLTVAEVDDYEPYREAVRFVLEHVHHELGYPWENDTADGYADALESGINLLNRIPVESAFHWVEHEARHMLGKQRRDGIIEGWHGDGNYARTALMVALWKTQGIQIRPWRADVSYGATSEEETLFVQLESWRPWKGKLVFDIQRHRSFFGIPDDYPRLNQFPEWFTVQAGRQYEVSLEAGGTVETRRLGGAELQKGLDVESGSGVVRISVSPLANGGEVGRRVER